MTITHDALVFIVQAPSPLPQQASSLDMGPHCTAGHPLAPLLFLVTTGGHYWILVQTCSLQDTPIGGDILYES